MNNRIKGICLALSMSMFSVGLQGMSFLSRCQEKRFPLRIQYPPVPSSDTLVENAYQKLDKVRKKEEGIQWQINSLNDLKSIWSPESFENIKCQNRRELQRSEAVLEQITKAREQAEAQLRQAQDARFREGQSTSISYVMASQILLTERSLPLPPPSWKNTPEEWNKYQKKVTQKYQRLWQRAEAD